MYKDAGLWDKAHAIAVTYMNETQVTSLYSSEALKLEALGQYKEAEKLYLTIKDKDSVILMYKKHRLYDDMIRVISAHKKEALQETELGLAKQFEAEGNVKAAEQHYVAAKEWKACYAMYKQQQQWEDALRVAKNYGGQQAYKQAAYEFAMAVGGEAAIKMLIKRGLAELAVEVAVERNEFDSAFSIAEKACKMKLPEVHLAHAMQLEDEGKFEAAEREFVSAKKPKEAIDMWIHQQEWDNAMRICHDFEPAALHEIVEAEAKCLISKKDFKAAETLYVAHKKATEAVKMYSSDNQWDEALRVAKQHAPRLLQQVQSDKAAHQAQHSTADSDSLEYCLAQAQMCQSKRQFSQAIDHLLAITAQKCSDSNMLEVHWENALELAHDHVKQRVTEVLQTVTQRLIALEHYESASQFLVDHQQYQQAIDALLLGRDYNKAKAIATAHAPQLSAYVQSEQTRHLLSNNNLKSLAEVSPDVAIDAYANSGEWDKVYQLAAKQGENMTNKYASLHAASLLKQNKARSAVRVFLTHGCPMLPANFPLYKRIAAEVLLLAGDVENPQPSSKRHSAQDAFSPHAQSVLYELRSMLWALMKDLKAIDPTGSAQTQELDRLLLITHYAHLRFICSTQEVHVVLKRLSIVLLRYTRVLPVDKQFFDAGLACRSAQDLSQAFVFFNRFIDVTDLMADPDSGDIDNSDFLETDIPSPFDTPLPSAQFYSDEVREEAREWVLEKAMSHDIAQSLATRACDKCGSPTYEAGLTCHHCHFNYEPCIITGYPVTKSKRVSCGKCSKPANREDWNKLIARTKCCPWCQASAQPFY